MPKYRTSREYTRFPDPALSTFAGGVATGLTDNPKAPNPPESPASLLTKRDDFSETIIAASGGGPLQTALKDASRAVLTAALNKDASYVDIITDDDLATLLSTGYQPVSTNRARVVLSSPMILGAMAGPLSGQIKLHVRGDRNRKAIQGQIKPLDGEYGPVITFEDSRQIVFKGLVAGTTYVMQLMGIGGSTGQSDWSAPISKLAI